MSLLLVCCPMSSYLMIASEACLHASSHSSWTATTRRPVSGVRDAIARVIDDWGFRYPGIADVVHVYFHAVTTATPELVQQYFAWAYQPGRTFDRSPTAS